MFLWIIIIYLLQGLTEPTGLCTEGYFCLAGSTTSTPDEESMGGECQPGYFCPEGSFLQEFGKN